MAGLMAKGSLGGPRLVQLGLWLEATLPGGLTVSFFIILLTRFWVSSMIPHAHPNTHTLLPLPLVLLMHSDGGVFHGYSSRVLPPALAH